MPHMHFRFLLKVYAITQEQPETKDASKVATSQSATGMTLTAKWLCLMGIVHATPAHIYITEITSNIADQPCESNSRSISCKMDRNPDSDIIEWWHD